MQTCFLLTLFTGLWLAACAAPQQAPPVFEITTAKPQDQVTYTWQDDTAFFDIRSESGIGSARVVRTAGNMPPRIIIRAHLRGLENFTFTFAQDKVEVSIPSSGNHTPILASQHEGSTEYIPLNSNSPLWMPTRIVSNNPAIPLNNGYFEMGAPRAFLEGDTREFSIAWIDFYR